MTEARADGISAFVLRDPRWAAPFRGMRADQHDPAVPWHHIEAYGARMMADQFFSHTSAALAHGLLIPRRALADLRPHVSTRKPHGQPRCVGVRGHQLDQSTRVVMVRGLPVTSAEDTWCQLASVLPVDDLVALGDLLVTGTSPFDGAQPPISAGELDAALQRHRGQRGIRSLREARELIRFGPLSPMETHTRLAIVRAGLPEPVLNYRVERDDGSLLAIIDLAYPDYKLGIEYEGDGHRERGRFRKDTTRFRQLDDAGWLLLRLTVEDLYPSPHAFIRQIYRGLRTRGAPI